jgi:flagellar biosynthesis/type III secretory pathway protein FliH
MVLVPYQMYAKGLEEGRQRGLEEGMQRGLKEGIRQKEEEISRLRVENERLKEKDGAQS